MILATGGTGFVGSHLVEALLARGETVRCLVRRQSSLRYVPAADLAYCDFTTGDGLDAALEGADAVIHLAGVTKALAARDYYSGNVDATRILARAAAARGVRFVHVSSLAAIGPSPDGSPLDEDASPHPVTPYGKSKLEAERIVRALLPDAVIVRPPVVYGPRDTDVFQVLKSISRGLMLEISGGERWFSAIYVKDLAEGLIAAAHSPEAVGRTYFLAHPQPVSWAELGATAACIMGRRVRTLRIPAGAAYAAGFCAEMWSRLTRRPGKFSRDMVAEARCPSWTCDPRRARLELGFEASTTLEAGLASTLAWYKEAGWIRY